MNKKVILVDDKKFKSIFVSVNFIRKLDMNEAGKNALVASILKKGTRNLKSEREIEIELAKLYSSSIDINVEKIGGFYNTEFSAEFINKKYVDEDIMSKVINILYDVIYNPNTNEDMFLEDVFAREQEALIEKINQEKNDKRRWALRRLEEEMYDESDYKVSVLGSAEDISKETAKNLYNYYKKFVETSEVRIVITGDLEGYEDIADYLENKFIKNSNIEITPSKIINRENIKEVEDKEQLNQSVLCIGLNVKNTNVNLIPAIAVYNSILGGTPSSKLFQNVREKESLAYFSKSQYAKYINAIYIYSGININNVEKATAVINKQLEDIKQGNISAEEMKSAKSNILLSYKSLSDNKEAYSRYLLSNTLYYSNNVDINKFMQDIENVTVNDIVKVAKDIEINTIYLLGGRVNE